MVAPASAAQRQPQQLTLQFQQQQPPHSVAAAHYPSSPVARLHSAATPRSLPTPATPAAASYFVAREERGSAAGGHAAAATAHTPATPSALPAATTTANSYYSGATGVTSALAETPWGRAIAAAAAHMLISSGLAVPSAPAPHPPASAAARVAPPPTVPAALAVAGAASTTTGVLSFGSGGGAVAHSPQPHARRARSRSNSGAGMGDSGGGGDQSGAIYDDYSGERGGGGLAHSPPRPASRNYTPSVYDRGRIDPADLTDSRSAHYYYDRVDDAESVDAAPSRPRSPAPAVYPSSTAFRSFFRLSAIRKARSKACVAFKIKLVTT